MTNLEPAQTLWRGGQSLSVSPATRPAPAQRCLVRAATGPVDEIEGALEEWRSLVDLRGPIDGGSYRLIPMVFHRLQAEGLLDPNRGMFKGVYRLSIVENTRSVHAVTPALRALGTAGITPWLSKGAGLVSAGYYPTLATRPMSDIDVVVDSTERIDAIDVLKSVGYTTIVSDHAMGAMHAAPFTNDLGARIDLHWHHLSHVRSSRADAVITRESHVVEFNGVTMKVPGPTGMLIIAAVHGMVSNPEPPVRWLVDAAMILERDSERIIWTDLVEFAKQFRLARRIEGALKLLAETTGHAAPDSTFAALAAIPTTMVERVERRISTTPWNSSGGTFLRMVVHYAGGTDRRLRHFSTRFPRHLAQRSNLKHTHNILAVVVRKLMERHQSRRTRSTSR